MSMPKYSGHSPYQDNEQAYDYSGLKALCTAAQQLMIKADPVQLAHSLGWHSPLSDTTLREAAAQLGLRTALSQGPGCPLSVLPLPALVKQQEGRWMTITAIEQDNWYLFDPTIGETLRHPLLTASQSDALIFMLLAQQDRPPTRPKFGLNWFSPALLRQKKQLRDIFGYAIILQLIALASPLLFENIIDKVLVGRSLDSLYVFGLAMLALACGEPLYSFLRSRVFSYLANQVNAELTGKLYRHLVNLPMSYFQARQTGHIIARVKEMAQIRQFLTGYTLSMVLDLVFIILFISVMINYSPTLTACVLDSLVIYFLLWLTLSPLLRKRVEAEYQADADCTSFLTEAVAGIETQRSPHFLLLK